MDQNFKQTAQLILSCINSSNSILLHCHPYPDPDSIGSVLATHILISNMGKKVTSILGDGPYPQNLSSLPDVRLISPKGFDDIDLSQFDLFIILDSSSLTQISQKNPLTILPKSLKTINIDHHITNTQFADINLISPNHSSTSEILLNIFEVWGQEIAKNMALYLFLGIYADTGGFMYPNCKPDTLKSAHTLASINPNYHQFIFDYKNSKTSAEILIAAKAITNTQTYFNDKVAISTLSHKQILDMNIKKEDAFEGLVADTLRSVVGWEIVASLVEAEPGKTTVSLRTRDEKKNNMAEIAKSIGVNGGGHRGAAGTTILKPLNESLKDLLPAIELQLSNH